MPTKDNPYDYSSVSLNKDDIANLRDIWETTLRPLGINYSSPAVIRYLIKMQKMRTPQKKGEK